MVRLLATAFAVIVVVTTGVVVWPGIGLRTVFASTGSMGFNPNPRLTAWNADSFSIDVMANNVDVTTQCATNPNDPQSPLADCGLGAFEFTVSWDPAKLAYVSAGQGPFLSSTGRGVSCFAPVVGPDSVEYRCVTLGPSPLGPQGSGKIATLTFEPLVPGVGGTTALTFTDGHYNDIAGAAFPATFTAGTVEFGFCMDVSGDGGVDFSDVLDILARFGSSVPPEDPKYDPTLDGGVDFSDSLYALGEFGQSCVL
jgi:hypothetical protein